MAPICTIGYEGFSPTSWLDVLKANAVEVVVDVRDLPVSRKPGFSKNGLESRLACAGIAYVHVKELGNPAHLRVALKDGLPFREFANDFSRLLEDREDALGLVLDLARTRRVCLLCFEEDPHRCHRSLVAERLIQTSPEDVEVVHFRHADAH